MPHSIHPAPFLSQRCKILLRLLSLRLIIGNLEHPPFFYTTLPRPGGFPP